MELTQNNLQAQKAPLNRGFYHFFAVILYTAMLLKT